MPSSATPARATAPAALPTSGPPVFARLAQAAEDAAADAWRACPGPVGWCGSALVTLPARTAFARWLVATGRAVRHPGDPGVTVGPGRDALAALAGGDPDRHQSKALHVAWAQGYAAVLRRAGLAGVAVRVYDD